MSHNLIKPMRTRMMPRWMPVALFTGLAALVVFSASAQQMQYSVFLNNKPVGSLDARRSVKDGLANYLIQSDVKFHFVFKMNLNYTFESTYQNDMLIKGSTRNVVNKDERSASKITWNGSYYVLEVKDERSVLKNTRINYSMVSLYFREPTQVTQVFSERHGKFLPIKSLPGHRYEITMPDGKKNYYAYANGICQLVEVQHTLGKVLFKLISPR